MKMDSFPNMKDVPPDKRDEVFMQKLKYCERVLDFTNTRAQFMQKETKRRQLVDLSEYITDCKGAINERTAPAFMQMVTANLIRALPNNGPSDLIVEAEDDESFYEPSWPHLKLVYDMLRKFILSTKASEAGTRAAITVTFVKGVIDLFNSEDPRERECLKTILHRIYGKIMPLRDAIRQTIIDVFHRVVYDGMRQQGMCELLEILGSIIHGFSVPLKDEHKDLLRNGILSLHLPSTMPTYHVQLAFCVCQYAEKEAELGAEIIATLLRHWPVRNSRKEVLLLSEIEEVLELIGEDEAEPIVPQLFRRLGRAIESPQFQVAERALFYWNNDVVLDVFDRYRDLLMPAIVGPLMKNTRSHWNRNVLLLSKNVLESLNGLDTVLYDKCVKAYELDVAKDAERQKERLVRWGLVYRMAEMRGKGKSHDGVTDDANFEDEEEVGGESGKVKGGMGERGSEDCDELLKSKLSLNGKENRPQPGYCGSY